MMWPEVGTKGQAAVFLSLADSCMQAAESNRCICFPASGCKTDLCVVGFFSNRGSQLFLIYPATYQIQSSYHRLL